MKIAIKAKLAALAGAALVSASLPASAQQSTLVFTGFDTTWRDHYGYVGGVYAFNRNLDTDGWLLSAFAGGASFNFYNLTPQTRATGWFARAGVGYQFLDWWGRAAFYVGYAYRDFNVSPFVPRTAIVRFRHGVHLQADGYLRANDYLGVEYIVSFTAVPNDFFARVRPYFTIDAPVRIGPEFTVLTGRQYDQQRYGVFVAGVPLGPFSLGGKVGLEFSSRNNRTAGYGGVDLSIRF